MSGRGCAEAVCTADKEAPAFWHSLRKSSRVSSILLLSSTQSAKQGPWNEALWGSVWQQELGCSPHGTAPSSADCNVTLGARAWTHPGWKCIPAYGLPYPAQEAGLTSTGQKPALSAHRLWSCPPCRTVCCLYT